MTEVASETTRWYKGEPPLRCILMVWNGTAIFGPVSFRDESHRKLEMDHVATAPGGAITHYLVLPKVVTFEEAIKEKV